MTSCSHCILEHVETHADSCRQRLPSRLLRTGTLQREGPQEDKCLVIVRRVGADVPPRAVSPKQVAGKIPKEIVTAVQHFELLVSAEELDHGEDSETHDGPVRVEQARVMAVNRYPRGIIFCQKARADKLMTRRSEDQENFAPQTSGDRNIRQGSTSQPEKKS